jgi:hypothetical protein
VSKPRTSKAPKEAFVPLRAYIATHVLAGLSSRFGWSECGEQIDLRARKALRHADALIRALAEEPTK